MRQIAFVLFTFAEISWIKRHNRPEPFGLGHRNVGGIVEILRPQHLAERAEIGDREKGRQLIPAHEQIQELEEPDTENCD
jgi:hypothetical protein